MGRPRKPPEEKYGNKIRVPARKDRCPPTPGWFLKIRVDPDQKALLDAAAAAEEQDLAPWARALLLRAAKSKVPPAADG